MSKNFLGQKQILGRKNFWVKNFLVKKNLASKNFLGQKELGPKNFLSKKTGRVNPRGRIYDSPPTQKIIGLKFCWVVLSCPKIFFVKKKNIGRGGVDDPPPPENSRVKILLVRS